MQVSDVHFSWIKAAVPSGMLEIAKTYRVLSKLQVPLGRRLRFSASSKYHQALKFSRLKFLRNIDVNQLRCVVDVGAHEGAWSSAVLPFCALERLIAVEPDPELVTKLQNNLKPFPCVNILNVAVGAEKGFIEFNVNSSSTANSILETKQEVWNSDYLNDIHTVSKVQVPLDTLDNLLAEIPEISLLKIDVQGYEKFVLEGAKETLKKTRYLIVEANFISHYEGDILFPELHELLSASGFFLQNLSEPHFGHYNGSRIMWLDAIYVSGLELAVGK